MLYQLSYAPWSVRPKVVGLTGFEPVTSRLSGGRSNQLSYRPRGGTLLLENSRVVRMDTMEEEKP